jgi:hypothetical protein
VIDNFVSSSETNKDFGYWSAVDWMAESSRAAVLGASVVVVPIEGYREYSGPVFPVGTAEFFQFLKDTIPSGTLVEIAVDDADFKELAVHADVFTIATILLRDVVVPVLVP